MSIYYFIQSKKNFENIWSGIHLTAVQSQSRFQVTPRYFLSLIAYSTIKLKKYNEL